MFTAAKQTCNQCECFTAKPPSDHRSDHLRVKTHALMKKHEQCPCFHYRMPLRFFFCVRMRARCVKIPFTPKPMKNAYVCVKRMRFRKRMRFLKNAAGVKAPLVIFSHFKYFLKVNYSL